MIRAGRLAATGFVAIGLVLSLGIATAFGFWTAGSVFGSGASAAAALDRGATPTAVATGTSVTVDWAATTLTSGQAATGYIVSRYDATTLAPQPILSACDGTVVADTCTETGVPGGSWVYSVAPEIGLHWLGSQSPMSNVVDVDSTPPTNDISSTTVTGGAFSEGNTVFYRGIAAGSFTLSNAVIDNGSGPASSTTAAITGDSTGWSHVPSTVSSPSAGPYVSNLFSWTAGTTSAPSEVVTGRDVAGNSTSTTVAFTNDSTAPTPGTIGYLDGYQPQQSVSVAFTAGTDSGSGIATRQLQRSAAVLTAGVCGAFGAFVAVGPDHPASPYVDSTVANGSCDRYRYVVTDQVGNQDIATSANVAWVDSSAGGPQLGTAGSYSVLGTTGVTSTGLTTVSGDLGVSPSTAVVGFPPGIVAGTIHAGDTAAAQAQSDLAAAYADAAGRTPTSAFAGDLIGRTFDAGVYHAGAAIALTGTLTLDGQGNPNSLFIFQVNAALGTAAASNVVLVNGAQASHVFWQVNGAVTTGAGATFSGTIMANGAITLGAGTDLTGRALAYGAVTLAGNSIAFSSAVAPTVTIDGGATAMTKNTTPTITGTSNAPAGTTVTVTVAGQVLTTSVQGDGSWNVTAATLSAGLDNVVAVVRDSEGDAGSATQALTVEVNPTSVSLGTAGSYSALGTTGVTSTGVSSVSGDLGVSPSTAVVGFPPGIVLGTIHPGDAAAAQAQSDLVAAYADAAGRTPSTELAGDLIGRTFDEGVYHAGAAIALTGTLTLDGQGDPNAVFIFQVNAALGTAAASHVVLINGAQASNVFWQVNGAATTGAGATFAGTIMANGAISLGAGTALTGRALAIGAVTLDTSTVTTS